MLTKKWFELLENHSGKELLFQLEDGTLVSPSYHITEVKNVLIKSVDCGAKAHEEEQTIVQLWVPKNGKDNKALNTVKALKIFKQTDKIQSTLSNAEIYFEYGDSNRRTSVYFVKNTEIKDDQILVHLDVKPTACKPLGEFSKSGSCC